MASRKGFSNGEPGRRGGGLGKTVFMSLLALLAVFTVVRLGSMGYHMYRLHQENEAAQARVEQLKKTQADLEAEKKRLYDPKYIEKLAREDHNMVGKNEVPLFIVKDKQEEPVRKADGKDGKSTGKAADGRGAGDRSPSGGDKAAGQ